MNVSFVKIEIGESSPTEVRIDIDRSSYVLGTRAGSAMKFDEHHVSRKHATSKMQARRANASERPQSAEAIESSMFGVRLSRSRLLRSNDVSVRP